MCALSQYIVFHMSGCIQEGYRGNIHLCVLIAIFLSKSYDVLEARLGKITGMSTAVFVCVFHYPAANLKKFQTGVHCMSVKIYNSLPIYIKK